MSRINRPSVLALEGRTLLTASPRLDSFAVPTLPGQIVDGLDGDLWYDENFGGIGGIAEIGRITPQGQVTEIPLQTPSGSPTPDPSAIAAGSDGNLWDVDLNNSMIDRIGQDGQVATYPIPANQIGGTTPSIVAGADGNLWFTTGLNSGGWDSSQELPNGGVPGTIDRITPDGVITSFALPLGGGIATALAAGPDGIWFTDPQAGRVGEMDYSGHAVEYSAPSAWFDISPSTLTVGPDGDAYYYAQGSSTSFTDFQDLSPFLTYGTTSFIVKVAPGGAITPIAIPGSIQSIPSMVSGPDGIDFLVESLGAQSQSLDQLSLDGTVSTLSTDSSLSYASGLAFGPDGNLWISEPGEGAIARLDLSSTPEPVPGPTLLGGSYPSSTLIEAVGQSTTFSLANVTISAGVTVDSATIDWGDGSTPTAGTYVADPSGPVATLFGGGRFSGSHAYAKAGSYIVTITIDGTGPTGAAMTTSVVDMASAVDPAPTTQPPLAGLQASQSIAYQQPLAIFATPTPHDASGSDFTATIDWGDGSAPTSGTVGGGYEQDSTGTPPYFNPEPNGPVGFFEVSGDHTYAKTGTFTVKVTLSDTLGNSSTESTSIQVEPGPLVLDPPSPILTTADPTPASFGPVLKNIDLGTLTDFLGNLADRTDSVTVDWGDGSAPTAVSLSPSGPVQNPPLPGPVIDDIYGTHAYAQAGTYTVKIFAQDNQGDLIEATTTAQVSAGVLTLTPPENSPSSPAGQPVTVGQPISSLPLAMIAAPNAADPASDFTATINWGDGSTPTVGTIGTVASTVVTTSTGSGSQVSFGESYSDLEVSGGGHTYAQAGLYNVTVTVDGPDGTTAQIVTITSVSPANEVGTSTPAILSFTAGVASAPSALGSFSSNIGSTAADFTATVDWGDGSPIQSAPIQPAPNQVGSNEFNVVAGHDYAQPGTYTATVSIVGADSLPDIISSQATVTALAAPVVVVSPVVIANPASPTPTPVPIASPSPSPYPSPSPSPYPSPAPSPMPLPVLSLSPSVPISKAPSFAMVLPSPFPRFEPTIAKNPGPVGPKPTRHPAHKATKQHVATKPVHVALPKKQPARPARLPKTSR
jgi:streptogramin lyase/PKD repeat protein